MKCNECGKDVPVDVSGKITEHKQPLKPIAVEVTRILETGGGFTVYKMPPESSAVDCPGGHP